MNVAKVINCMRVTEKSSMLNEKNKSVTVLTSSCKVTKLQMKRAIQYMFPESKVKQIRSMTLRPKVKIFKGRKGLCVKRKKMIISFDGKKGFSMMSEIN